MHNREVVIFNNQASRLEASKKLAESLRVSNAFDKVTIFTRNVDAKDEELGIKVIPDSCDNISKARNFINMSFRANKFTGFLHVLEDTIELKKELVPFLDALERMMDVLDYDVWFDTSCDPCNYVYSKFNPRVSIDLDVPNLKNLGLPENIFFTSHSNTAWICYNFSKIEDDLLKFNESFNIPMFMIIEFLARRRNNRRVDQIYRMNMYMTIPEEFEVFEISLASNKEDFNSEQLAKEDKIFKSFNINFAPDNNIDELLECFWSKLKSKM